MNLDEYIRRQIELIISHAATTTAALIDDPAQAAAVPHVFFLIEQRLLATWQATYEEYLIKPEEEPND